MTPHFQLLKTDSVTAARRGRLQTRHGVVETPIFMPVGTQGTVKSLTPAHLSEIYEYIGPDSISLRRRPGYWVFISRSGADTDLQYLTNRPDDLRIDRLDIGPAENVFVQR